MDTFSKAIHWSTMWWLEPKRFEKVSRESIERETEIEIEYREERETERRRQRQRATKRDRGLDETTHSIVYQHTTVRANLKLREREILYQVRGSLTGLFRKDAQWSAVQH